MSEFKLTTPVAFIIFNRPDNTERVFAEIAKAKPEKLFLISDGPREGNLDDILKVAEVRRIVSKINWPCEVFTNFSIENLGCKLRPKTGIDWVFDYVEEVIILEDDCLPDQSFFVFCQELLDKYRYDQRFSMISGLNLQPNLFDSSASYFFSRYVGTWGWATWRNRWHDSYDIDMIEWPNIKANGWLFRFLDRVVEAKYWTNIFDAVYTGKMKTAWDYQWLFAGWISHRLCIVPSVNLISNIGFGAQSTHTKDIESKLSNMFTESMTFPLNHPTYIIRNTNFDYKIFDNVYNHKKSLVKRVSNKLLSYLIRANPFFINH